MPASIVGSAHHAYPYAPLTWTVTPGNYVVGFASWPDATSNPVVAASNGDVMIATPLRCTQGTNPLTLAFVFSPTFPNLPSAGGSVTFSVTSPPAGFGWTLYEVQDSTGVISHGGGQSDGDPSEPLFDWIFGISAGTFVLAGWAGTAGAHVTGVSAPFTLLQHDDAQADAQAVLANAAAGDYLVTFAGATGGASWGAGFITLGSTAAAPPTPVSLSASVTTTASISRVVKKNLSALASAVASMARLGVVSQVLSATVSMLPSMTRSLSRTLSASLSATGLLDLFSSNSVTKVLTATVTTTATMTLNTVRAVLLAATVVTSASFLRAISMVRTATVSCRSFIDSLIHAIIGAISATERIFIVRKEERTFYVSEAPMVHRFYATKTAPATKDWQIDWSRWLAGDRIVSSSWRFVNNDAGLTFGREGVDQAGQVVTLFVGGGATIGASSTLLNTIFTANNDTETASITITIEDS